MECICYVKFTRHRRVVVGDIEEFALVAGKITLCVETFPAFRTHVLQIPRVQSLMSLKVWSLVECLVAECAAEHPLATVYTLMRLQTRTVCESFPALLAGKGALPRVCPLVVAEVGLLVEPPAAHVAGVLEVPRVRPLVVVNVANLFELLVAVGTLVGVFSWMDFPLIELLPCSIR